MDNIHDYVNAQILSIFHEMTTDIPGRGTVNGLLLVAKDVDGLLFVWQPYPIMKNGSIVDESYMKLDITMHISNVQRIMVNYQKDEKYLLFSTRNPSNMYQFGFPKIPSYQPLLFVQVLSLYQQTNVTETKGIGLALHMSAETFVCASEHYRLYDMSVDNSQIQINSDFSIDMLDPQNVTIVKPDLHIISQFNIDADGYISNPIQLSDLKDFNNIEELKIGVQQRGVHPDARHIIWPIIFSILPFNESERSAILEKRLTEYSIIRNQWRTLSPTQMKYFSMVRDAFSTIRVDVKRTHPQPIVTDTPNWADILISILRTFTMWNLDVRYTQGLNDLAVNFMSIFLPAARSKEKTDEEAEALAFWCFAAFVEKVSSGLIAENMMVMQERELKQIMGIIEHFHPACAKWLRANGLSDLSFLISSFILAYGRSFAQPTIARIWEALVCVDRPWLFLRYFSASLLIICAPSFNMIPNCSTGKLVSLMDQIFWKQDVGAVIGVSLSMMKNSKIEVLVSDMGKNIPIIQPDPPLPEGYDRFFIPNLTYLNKPELFS